MRSQLRNMLALAISFLLLAAFLVASFNEFNNRLFAGLWWDFVWWTVAACLVLIFCMALWPVLENENNLKNRRSPDWHDREKILKNHSDIHLAHFDHAHQEVTRYRDLPWQIGLLTWGIYYALIWFKNDNVPQKIATLSLPLFFILCFSAAISACVFLLFCEVSANRNRAQRREIADELGLHERWLPTEAGERLTRLGFLFSMLVFLAAVWVPPLVMLFYRTSS